MRNEMWRRLIKISTILMKTERGIKQMHYSSKDRSLQRWGAGWLSSPPFTEQGTEAQRGAHTCEAASLGLQLCAGDAEKRGSCLSSSALGSEGSSVYSTVLSCTSVPILREPSGKGKSTARNAVVLLCQPESWMGSVKSHRKLPVATRGGRRGWGVCVCVAGMKDG